MKPFWITFYSYKGGVGRSLALANTAALLVEKGRRVVLIDFDLEAPGLDSFQEFAAAGAKPGVVEYVAEFDQLNSAPDISQFVHPCELPGHLRGKLWIMPAGRKDAAYNSTRVNLNWARLYESGRGEPFVENWKAAIARHCQPDYVLVDSRTGLTDVGGICTLHVPDLVVLLFGLNEQNVRGVGAVAKTIRESDYKRVPQLHYVASPVPTLPRDKEGPLTKRLTAAIEHLGTKIDSLIFYHPVAALSERLFVLEKEFESLPLIRDYIDLLTNLTQYNRNGLDFLWKQTNDAIKDVDTSLMERLVAVFAQEFPDRPESLMARAKLNKALGDVMSANNLAQRAFEADPTYDLPLEWLLKVHSSERDYEAAARLSTCALKHAERLPPHQRYRLNTSRGNYAMASGDYSTAFESFNACLKYLSAKQEEGEPDPASFLVHLFNATEAFRRATRSVNPAAWRGVVKLFELSGETSDAPLVYQANRWQAIHIPLALIGDLNRSRDALTRARHAAELLGMAEDIFSVKTYTEVSVKEFLETNDEMLAALERCQLWDGMPLSATASIEETPSPETFPHIAPTPSSSVDPTKRPRRSFELDDSATSIL